MRQEELNAEVDKLTGQNSELKSELERVTKVNDDWESKFGNS